MVAATNPYFIDQLIANHWLSYALISIDLSPAQFSPWPQTVVRPDPGSAGSGLQGQDPDHQGDGRPGGRLRHLLDTLQCHVSLVVDREVLETEDKIWNKKINIMLIELVPIFQDFLQTEAVLPLRTSVSRSCCGRRQPWTTASTPSSTGWASIPGSKVQITFIPILEYFSRKTWNLRF